MRFPYSFLNNVLFFKNISVLIFLIHCIQLSHLKVHISSDLRKDAVSSSEVSTHITVAEIFVFVCAGTKVKFTCLQIEYCALLFVLCLKKKLEILFCSFGENVFICSLLKFYAHSSMKYVFFF